MIIILHDPPSSQSDDPHRRAVPRGRLGALPEVVREGVIGSFVLCLSFLHSRRRAPLTRNSVPPRLPVCLQDGAVHGQQQQDGARGAGQSHDGHPEALHRLPHQQQAAQGNKTPLIVKIDPSVYTDGWLRTDFLTVPSD